MRNDPIWIGQLDLRLLLPHLHVPEVVLESCIDWTETNNSLSLMMMSKKRFDAFEHFRDRWEEQRALVGVELNPNLGGSYWFVTDVRTQGYGRDSRSIR